MAKVQEPTDATGNVRTRPSPQEEAAVTPSPLRRRLVAAVDESAVAGGGSTGAGLRFPRSWFSHSMDRKRRVYRGQAGLCVHLHSQVAIVHVR